MAATIRLSQQHSCSFLHRSCWPFPFFHCTPKALFTQIDLAIRPGLRTDARSTPTLINTAIRQAGSAVSTSAPIVTATAERQAPSAEIKLTPTQLLLALRQGPSAGGA